MQKQNRGASIGGMSTFKAIRSRLGVTQAVIAEALGVTQGNVSFYEKGQTVPPAVAARLIEYADRCGLELSYDIVYGNAPLPSEPAKVA